MASRTSFPRSSSTGRVRYFPRGSASTTTSAPAAAAAAVTATAPGASTSTVSAIFAGSPEPATSTRYPAATARRASIVPTLPAPRIPSVSGALRIDGLPLQQLDDARAHLGAKKFDGPRTGFDGQAVD